MRGARNIERFMIVQLYSSGILSSDQRSKRRRKPNTNKIVHLIINNSQFIWVKNDFHIGIHCLYQAIIIGLHDASWRAKLESNDYPLLQHSKVKLIEHFISPVKGCVEKCMTEFRIDGRAIKRGNLFAYRSSSAT